MARAGKEFVLVHGAAHGAWCWDEVARHLGGKGHRVVTLDLPGHGRRAAEARHASVLVYARAVADTMACCGVSRGIVVGHSMAGVVISRAAELVPERIAHLVYLAAVVVPRGSSVAETLWPPAFREALRAMATGNGGATFLFPAEAAWARWMGDLPRHHPAVSRALSLLTPQAIRPLMERVDLATFYTLQLPRAYVRCLEDRAIPPERAAANAARLGVAPVDLRAAHDPMLSQPAALATLLERVAR
jgi:pimeloyl-ACP methyl ester carboxylesterase